MYTCIYWWKEKEKSYFGCLSIHNLRDEQWISEQWSHKVYVVSSSQLYAHIILPSLCDDTNLNCATKLCIPPSLFVLLLECVYGRIHDTYMIFMSATKYRMMRVLWRRNKKEPDIITYQPGGVLYPQSKDSSHFYFLISFFFLFPFS